MSPTGSEQIQEYLDTLTDWRGDLVREFRTLIQAHFPELVEEWKWKTPLWSWQGNVVAAGVFKDHVKLNFFKGALIEDQSVFNAGLDAKQTRGIDYSEGDSLNAESLIPLLKAAVALNQKPAKKQK